VRLKTKPPKGGYFFFVVFFAAFFFVVAILDITSLPMVCRDLSNGTSVEGSCGSTARACRAAV
jgi:hypothetical protein